MRLGLPSAFYIMTRKNPGGFADGETPLPIPNREVKPIRADGTMLVTAWESRSLPGLFFVKDEIDYNDENIRLQ